MGKLTQQDTQPPAETLAIIEMLQAAEVQEGVTVFDHSAEEIGIAVMENHRAVLAALTRRAGGDAIPAGEGEPVAWRWERRGRFGPEIGAWEQVFTPYPPDKWPEDDRRNIVPLYATPKPPAGGDAGAVERNIEAQRQTIEACARLADRMEGGLNIAGAIRRLAPNAALALPAPVVEGERKLQSEARHAADLLLTLLRVTKHRTIDPTVPLAKDMLATAERLAALSEGRSHG